MMNSFLEGTDRRQSSLLPPGIEDQVAPDALVRMVDALQPSTLPSLASSAVTAAMGRPGCYPGGMLRLDVWGSLNLSARLAVLSTPAPPRLTHSGSCATAYAFGTDKLVRAD